MNADTALLSRADRERLTQRVDELAGLDRLMRERGSLADAPEPEPLHRRSGKTKFSTTTKTKFSTNLVTPERTMS